MLLKFKPSLTTRLVLLVLGPASLLLIGIGLILNAQVNRMMLGNAQVAASSFAASTLASLGNALANDLHFCRRLSAEAAARAEEAPWERAQLAEQLIAWLNANPRYSSIWCYLEPRGGLEGLEGSMVVSVFRPRANGGATAGARIIAREHYIQAFARATQRNQPAILGPYLQEYDPAHREQVITITHPLRLEGHTGFMAIDIPLDRLDEHLAGDHPFPRTTLMLTSQNGIIAWHSNPYHLGRAIYEVLPRIEGTHELSDRIRKAIPTQLQDEIQGEPQLLLATPAPIPGTPYHWTAIQTIPLAEIAAQGRGIRLAMAIAILLTLTAIGALIYLSGWGISASVRSFTLAIEGLAQGDIRTELRGNAGCGSEFEMLSEGLERHIEGLNRTERFAREIGKGNLNASFDLQSQRDILGMTLMEMQSSLVKAKQIEQERQDEERKQSWAVEGMAILGDLLRRNSDNLEDLAFSIIQKTVEYTGSLIGGIYIINQADGKEDTPTLALTASFAYDRRRYLHRVVESGEGLVGRCYKEARTIRIASVPKEYIKVTSGLGDAPPQSLILVPLRSHDDVLGVIELASLRQYEPFEIAFLERIGESIGSTLQSTRVAIRTGALLAKSLQQAEEMAAQEEEMRQNMEELQATQEAMVRKQEEQEILQEELKQEQALLNALLTAIPDYVYFKDTQSRFIRASKSMINLFSNFDSPDQLIGKSDYDFHSKANADSRFNEEQDIMKGIRPPIIDKVEFERYDNGLENWVSMTKMPLRDKEGAVIGIWGISKLVNDIKRAEIEANAKGQEAAELAEKLTSCRKEFKAMVAAIEPALLLMELSPNGRILSANRQAEALFGIDEMNLIGMMLSDLLPPKDDDQMEYPTLWNEIRHGAAKHRVFEGRIRKTPATLHQTYSPIMSTDGSRVVKVIAVMRKA